ncbi:methyltransferase domain-containing protein [Legionella maioricensis]|uniref:Class I SAM-dependent methyltransferase n=1 Tax=Legionella maioricensis TaxID=2896528 RepID=A0A9X2IC14_9GAMM|nr:methyltransferase domain-containing protein [Legionella maioricensis]MCL9684980.1 class I SAM-dependent methyltransferase [Legionella maioricensis]MCL9688123.1 class I SAM-dependent methyltransferase [Legionella maioricensis]
MLIEQQIKQYRALNEWFNLSLGLSVANEFSEQLKSVNDYLRGETLLQLGNCGDNPWLNMLNFNRKWIASPFALNNKIHLECSFNQIPLNRNSLDCVLAPLTLEPYGNSLSLIDEIDRILKPMGFIILLSINPWSLWGGAMKCGLLHCYNDRAIKMRTPFHVNRVFLQRGYRQCALSNFCYIPPVNSKSLIKKLTFFDEVGKMLWPFPSGFYCYIAQKFEAISPSLITAPIEQPASKKYKSPLQPATN